MTVRDLADIVGMHYTNVAAKERGEVRIKPPERRKFAEALGMTLEDFDSHWRGSRIDQTQNGQGIPVINRAPAGLVIDYEEYGVDSGQGVEYIERGTVEDPLAFAVIVVGDSMEPELRERDYAIFSPIARVPKPRAELNEDGICFLRVSPEAKNCGCCIARYKGFDGERILFDKVNPKYKGFAVPREQVEQLAVLVEMRRNFLRKVN